MKNELNRAIMAKLETRLYNSNFRSTLSRGNIGVRAKAMNDMERACKAAESEKSKIAARGNRMTNVPVQQE
ncbi:MAG: hypothetical protein ACOX4P_07145 [Anaerovoracaceae bacterium]|jgi:hypothetical protein